KMHAMASRYCARGQIAIFDRRLPPPSISLHTSSRHFIAIQHVQFTSMKCLNSNFFNISGKSDRGAIPRTALQSATAEAPTSPVREDSNDDESDLQNFLSWLVANGVQGIGQEGSKLALFQSENGERGLMCEEPVSKGDVVLEVPLRLALTDHSEDAESNQLLYPGAPWSVRLACKLLRHLAAGKRSPWAPYIKVLPRHVPAPLESFTWEDISALRYPSAQEALHSADWLRADAFMATSEEARGGLGEEAFRWALSVVHSRTFANAAPGGGVGVRMLVPLVDMLNHGGDEVVAGSLGLGGNKVVATDTVRWDLLPPARSSSGGWSMAVSATKDLQPGQEVLLSYGERPNDDFFLHYGFVPRANPHDDAVLWPDLESSLEWHYERIGAVKLPREEAQELYLAALEEGRREQVAEMRQMRQQQQKSGADSVGGEEEEQQAGDVPPEIARQLAQIKVLAGGQVTAAVMRAFTAVSGGDLAAAERAVAFRCAEVLWNMAPPSTSPFVVTGADEAPSGTTRPPVADGAADGDMRGGAAQHIESYRSGEDVADEEVVTNATTGGGGGGLLMELAMLLADDDPRLVTAAAAEEEAEKVEPDSDEARFWAEQLRGYHQVYICGSERLCGAAGLDRERVRAFKLHDLWNGNGGEREWAYASGGEPSATATSYRLRAATLPAASDDSYSYMTSS
ncbi:hypothetical protein Vretifemale_2854, partial [Volvox reticuliferus]